MLLWCYVCLVLLRFRLNAFFPLKPRPFVRSFFVLRCACVPTATRVFSFFPFFLFFSDMSLFSSIFVRLPFSLSMERARRTFSPSGQCFFYLVTTGWIFDISLICENSINQSINLLKVLTLYGYKDTKIHAVHVGYQSHLLRRCHPVNTVPVVTKDLPILLTLCYRHWGC